MKQKNPSPLLIAALLLLLILPALDAEAQRRRTVDRHGDLSSLAGMVTDSKTGSPVVGATVEVQSRFATTDKNGRFALGRLASGTFEVSVGRWGYETRREQIDIGLGDNTFDVTIVLKPVVTLVRTSGEVETYAVETVRFGYIIPFAGTFTKPTLPVCTGDPEATLDLSPVEMAEISGPAVRIDTSCCSNYPGEIVSIRLVTGETIQAILSDSCPPNDIYFSGRNLDTLNSTFRKFSEVDRIVFPHE